MLSGRCPFILLFFFCFARKSLKIKHLKKIHFLVPEYDNLTIVKTHRDRLENSREGILERGVQIFGFGEGKGPHRGFECCLVVAFHFSVYSAHESSKFFSFLLQTALSGFHLRVLFFIFFSFFIFSLSYYALENSRFIPNRWMIY